jgi:hypothetical protein
VSRAGIWQPLLAAAGLSAGVYARQPDSQVDSHGVEQGQTIRLKRLVRHLKANSLLYTEHRWTIASTIRNPLIRSSSVRIRRVAPEKSIKSIISDDGLSS